MDILYVSHNMNTIRQLCDRCIVMDHGKIIFNGDVEEAIGIYLFKKRNENEIKYDYTDSERAYATYGKRVFMTDFTFLGVEKPIFEKNKSMRFKIGFDIKESISELKLYFILMTVSGERIGMAQTFEKFLDGEKDKHYDIEFSFDVSNLAAGSYCFQPDVCIVDKQGRHTSLDHPAQSIPFEIVDYECKGIAWKTYFSYVSLNPIKSKRYEE